MISQPDLLFRKSIENVLEEENLQLSHVADEKARDIFSKAKKEDYIEQLNDDLIRGFKPNVPTFQPISFPKDLGLDVLVRDFLRPKYSGTFLCYALARAPIDIPTIIYRCEILDELQENAGKIGQLDQIANQLANINALMNERSRKLWFRSVKEMLVPAAIKVLEIDLAILRQYVESINALEHVLKNSNSRGLASVHEYATRVQKTEEFKLISEMVDNYFNCRYVELGVTINASEEVEKSDYLAVGQNRLDRRLLFKTLAKIKGHGLDSILDNEIVMSYKKLLALAFDKLVDQAAGQVKNTLGLVGDIEFYIGAVRFKEILTSNNLPAQRPEFSAMEERKHSIIDMHHIMMEYDLNSFSNKLTVYGKIVPNSFHVDPGSNIIMVTGPNNGGKTRYSTGIGLVFVLGQSGYYVPAISAKLSIVDNIFTHFVSGDDADNKRGRWVDEVTRINKNLAGMTPYSLSLIDDFGSGTNYLEARVPALNVIYTHYRLGTALLMNSHLHQLAEDMENGNFPTASNWQVQVEDNQGKIKYNFKVVPGRAGRSFAQNVAEQHGLSKDGADRMIAKRIEKGELPIALIKPAFELKY